MPHDLFFVAGPVSATSCKEKLPPLDGATPTNGRIGSWQHGPCKESKSIIENCGSQTEWKCAWSSEHLSSPSFPIRKWWFHFHNLFVCRGHREAVEMTARSESGVVVCICALQHLREGLKGSWHVWTVWASTRTCSPGIIKAIQRFQTLACSEEGIIGSAWDSRAIQYRPWAPAAPRFTRAMICCDRSSNLAWSDIHLTVRMQWPTSQPLFFRHRPRSRRGATFTSCSMVPSQWLKVLMLRWVLLLRLNIRYLFNEIIVIYSYFIHIYEIYHSDIQSTNFGCSMVILLGWVDCCQQEHRDIGCDPFSCPNKFKTRK